MLNLFQVKAAWFTALLALINKAPDFLEDSHKKLCIAVFTNLDEDDMNVLPLVWETALLLNNVVPVN